MHLVDGLLTVMVLYDTYSNLARKRSNMLDTLSSAYRCKTLPLDAVAWRHHARVRVRRGEVHGSLGHLDVGRLDFEALGPAGVLDALALGATALLVVLQILGHREHEQDVFHWPTPVFSLDLRDDASPRKLAGLGLHRRPPACFDSGYAGAAVLNGSR